MPCFKGLAVSIHTPNGPLPEYSIQKQSRQSRISSYIPVPPPRVSTTSGRAEPSTFAISITLLTLGQVIPYSRPNNSAGGPIPEDKIVGGASLIGGSGFQSRYGSANVGPYKPLTSSINETVAAYIHFDGRPKEEVATLLRRGEETWVNSRWVSVPYTEGGGLAEREFLFREVGLERWLNGLDLQGEQKDVAARIERRKRRLEKKRRKREETKCSDDDIDKIEPLTSRRNQDGSEGVLRYGDDKQSPTETVLDDETMSSDSDSEDEMPLQEAAGQIKVSLFRVLASGEVRRGEFSPQFGAHDDDEMEKDEGNGGNRDADVDHTTTFAKPKSLDPKSISTQTVTGLDDPSRPYATFTFFYRGPKQLQKMGILPSTQVTSQSPASAKRKSNQLDLSSLKPLKSQGTVGFAGYRDSNKASKVGKSPDDDIDSDAEDDDETKRLKKSNGVIKKEEDEKDEVIKKDVSAEDQAKNQELAEGVQKMQLKRQRSLDASSPVRETNSAFNGESSGATTADVATTPTSTTASPAHAQTLNSAPPCDPPTSNPAVSKISAEAVPSPYKRQRASLSNGNPMGTNLGDGVKNPPPLSQPDLRSLQETSAGGLFHGSNSIVEDVDVSKHAATAEPITKARVQQPANVEPAQTSSLASEDSTAPMDCLSSLKKEAEEDDEML